MTKSSAKPWLVILVMTQVVSALIATGTDIFIYKIGVAVGSIILLIAYFNQ